jgi:hypothetical protein
MGSVATVIQEHSASLQVKVTELIRRYDYIMHAEWQNVGQWGLWFETGDRALFGPIGMVKHQSYKSLCEMENGLLRTNAYGRMRRMRKQPF